MELPQGIQTKHGNSKEHVLKLEKNIYGQKQTGCMWNLFLVDKLTSIGFTMSLIDDCVFFPGDIIFMVYVDDGIFLGSDNSELQEVIKEIQNLGLNIEDQGHPTDYIGVNIKKLCVCVCVNSATDALGLSHDGLSRHRAGLPAPLGTAVNKVKELPYNSPPKQITSPAKDHLHLHPLRPPGVRAPRRQVTKAAPTKTCNA